MLELVLFLPLIGFFFSFFFGNKIRGLIPYIASIPILVAFFISVSLFMNSGVDIDVNMYKFIQVGDFVINMGLHLDNLSRVMLVVVTFVSSMVHIYSAGYMHEDPGMPRFFSYISLFTFSMLFLVLGNNFFMLFIGWELVGLCSYLLVGFWFVKKIAADAALKAFVVNRVGDFGFYIGVLMVIFYAHSMNYADVFSYDMIENLKSKEFYGINLIDVITFFLFCGAAGKSAQFPLHTWLPDAMEGPTPISALIHAATMVTAGVYLIARTHPLFAEAPSTSYLVVCLGALTAFMGATIGIAQNDFKRALAYSTVSQLGYMFMAVGSGAYWVGIFHLFTHAFFKGLLFLCSGSVMHAMQNELDIRKMGGLYRKMPVTSGTFFIAMIAIAGIPPLAGFFSKDWILEEIFVRGHGFAWGVGALTAGITAFYMSRLYFRVFMGNPRDMSLYSHAHESPIVMTAPLMLLAIPSIFAGWLGFGGENSFFMHYLSGVFADVNHEIEGVSINTNMLMVVSLGISVIGLGLSYLFYVVAPAFPEFLASAMPRSHQFIFRKWFIDELYDFVFVKFTKNLAILLDIFEYIVVYGITSTIGKIPKAMGSILSFVHNGQIRIYMTVFTLGVIFVAFYLMTK